MLLLPAAWMHACVEARLIPVAGREPPLTSLCGGRGVGVVLSNALPPRHIRPYKTRSDDSEKMLRTCRTGAGSFWKALSFCLKALFQLTHATSASQGHSLAASTSTNNSFVPWYWFWQLHWGPPINRTSTSCPGGVLSSWILGLWLALINRGQ